MKRVCLLVLFLGIFFISCGKGYEQKGVRAQYKKISAQDARKLMQETGNFILLDVRTEVEHSELRIPGSKLLPNSEIATRAALELPDKNMPIVVYCRSGRRSEEAARELVRQGYTQVYDMGGIINWPYEKESSN